MRIILIAGPSGAGKDSLLRMSKESLANRTDVSFVRRYVTRPPDLNEQNYHVDPLAFAALKKSGFFVVDWKAHDNNYGITFETLPKADPITAIISVSRTVIPAFEAVFDDVITVLVTVPDALLRKRLEGRKRESSDQADNRLARARLKVTARNLIPFDNSAPLKETAPLFVELLEGLIDSSFAVGPVAAPAPSRPARTPGES